MLQKLRRRFIAIATGIMLGLELLLFLILNGVNYYQQKSKAEKMLDFLIRYEGVFPQKKRPEDAAFFQDPELAYITRYFTVRVLPDLQIAAVDTEHIAAVSPAEAMKLSNEILLSEQAYGKVGNYLFKMSRDAKDDIRLLVFLDISGAHDRVYSLLGMSAAILTAFAVLNFILLLLLSKRAVRPMLENENRQKQFIHDAGHELKTPLSVLSADIDVLEMCGQKNRWTESMRRQTERLGELIERLLLLARFEERAPAERVLLDPASVLKSALGQFEARFEAREIALELSAREGSLILIEASAYEELLYILADNMLKYAAPGSTAAISLGADGQSVSLSFCNEAPDFRPGDEERIFERFYRSDASRSRRENDPGGSGMGLAIARRICENYSGKIWADFDGKTLCIKVRFPRAAAS